jgi:hypothetical protein
LKRRLCLMIISHASSCAPQKPRKWFSRPPPIPTLHLLAKSTLAGTVTQIRRCSNLNLGALTAWNCATLPHHGRGSESEFLQQLQFLESPGGGSDESLSGDVDHGRRVAAAAVIFECFCVGFCAFNVLIAARAICSYS